jgi:hypothetical protein
VLAWLDTVDLFDLVACPGKADPQSFDFAEPSLALGFGDAVDEIVADLDQPGPLVMICRFCR